MKTLAIITQDLDALEAYYGFGFKQIETGVNKFGAACALADGPDEHAEWQALRLGSGLHAARIMSDARELAAWKVEMNYVTD